MFALEEDGEMCYHFRPMNQSSRLVLSFVVFATVCVPIFLFAMPSKAELDAAQPIVGKLMADDVAALEVGRIAPRAVAEKAIVYAQAATTDAEKYLLLQGAFYCYTNAREYDQATETVERLCAAIPDITPAVLTKMISRGLPKGRVAGRLSEMFERLKRGTFCAQPNVRADAAFKVASGEPKVADGVRPANQTFKLNEKTDLVMIGCPAGVGPGERNSDRQMWQVSYRISRPFWYAEVPTTFGQWLAFRPQANISNLALQFAGTEGIYRASPHDTRAYFDWLNKKFKSRLPKGYVFRLPTMAEWQYVWTAGAPDPTGVLNIDESNEMIKAYYLHEGEEARVEVGRKVAAEKGLSLTDDQLKDLMNPWSRLSARPAGRTKKTPWGISDAAEVTPLLDMLFEGVNGKRRSASPKDRTVTMFGLASEKELVDPFLYPSKREMPKDCQPESFRLFRMPFVLHTSTAKSTPVPFRVVLGPDLVKERELVP